MIYFVTLTQRHTFEIFASFTTYLELSVLHPKLDHLRREEVYLKKKNEKHEDVKNGRYRSVK